VGLSAYSQAPYEGNGIRADLRLYAPAVGGTIGILWFSAIVPEFKTRLSISSLACLVLAYTSLHALVQHSSARFSPSRKLLITLFSLLIVSTAVRFAIYMSMDVPADFHIESGASGWNLVSAIIL